MFNRATVDGKYSGRGKKEGRTILIGAADEGLALRAWPDHSGCRHWDAVLGPLLQPLQHHLLFTGRSGSLLQEVLVHAAAFWRAYHLVVHPVPHQGAVLTLQRGGTPTYPQAGRAGAAAFNVLGGGWGLWQGGKEERGKGGGSWGWGGWGKGGGKQGWKLKDGRDKENDKRVKT